MKKTSNNVLLKSIVLNFFSFWIHYPKLRYLASHTEKYDYEYLYKYAMKILKVVIKNSHVKVDVYGLENIPEGNGFYLCANHQEKFDPLFIWTTFPKTLGVILADKACHRPVIREICTLVKSKKLLDDDLRSVMSLYSEVTADLKKKDNYLIFPEGFYESDVPYLDTFHAGCFKSPIRAKCPIIPIALINSYKMFDKGFRSTKHVQIHYLKPVFPSEFEGLSTAEVSDLVKNRINEALEKYQF